MSTAPAAKPKCPECGTELVLVDGKLPENCAHCSFPLRAYQPFKRFLAAYEKERTPAAPAKKDSENGIVDFLKNL